MSLILKSDKVAKRNLGNTSGIVGATDYTLFLDFSAGVFKRNTADGYKDYALTDLVNVSRASKGEYIGVDGVSRVAEIDEPRIHYMQDVDALGLLIEPPRENLLTNPRSPQTQTVTIPNSGMLRALSLKVEGTGSATMSSADIEQLSVEAATENNPQSAMPIAGEPTIDVKVTITGEITRFQLERCASTQGGAFETTFVPDGVTERKPDKVTLVGDALIGLGDVKTVVCQYVYFDRGDIGFSGNNSVFALYDSKNPKGSIGQYKRKVGNSYSQESFVIDPNTTTLAKSNALATMHARKCTSALSFDTGGVDMVQAFNGILKTVEGSNIPVTPDSVYLGGNSPDTTASREAGGILTKVLFFDRKLTDSELAEITKSWI